jgi:SAM-dependent methyltransferase
MREHLASFSFVLPSVVGDPFSDEYKRSVIRSYERLSGRSLSVHNEHTEFDFCAALTKPFPYSTGSSAVVADYFLQAAYLLKALELDGGTIADMGPGWGNTSEMLARCGFDVWAVDINEDFCRLIRERTRRQGLIVNTLEGDFFSVADAPPLDGAVFFESFHHCLDHLRLLELLYAKVKFGGSLAFAGEPIVQNWFVPWGMRPDGMSAWSVRKFGWLELGFDEDYFLAALIRTGWSPRRIPIPSHPSAYQARKERQLSPGRIDWPAAWGWAEPETDRSFNHRFTTSATNVQLPKGAAEITLSNFRPADLRVCINGIPLEMHPGQELTVRAVHDGELLIESETWCPQTEVSNDDSRELGVAVLRIANEPSLNTSGYVSQQPRRSVQ